MKKDVLVTVVAPVLTGKQQMVTFTRDVVDLLEQSYTNYELVLVDAGADTDTIEGLSHLLKDTPCIRIIRLSQHANRDIMLFAGLESAIGDYVVAMTPGMDPVSVVTDLVEQMEQGRDIVYGISKEPLRRPWAASLGARLFYWYSKRYLGLSIPPNATYLVGLNRRSINALTRIKGRYRHVRHLTRQVGFKTAAHLYRTDGDGQASSERGFMESARLAKEIIVSYSRHPLQMVSTLGLIASGANLLYAVYVVAQYSLNKRVAEGWTTLSLEMSVMFFALFLILSVICEYIGRILEETRAQPAYHVMEELVSTALVADATRRNITK